MLLRPSLTGRRVPALLLSLAALVLSAGPSVGQRPYLAPVNPAFTAYLEARRAGLLPPGGSAYGGLGYAPSPALLPAPPPRPHVLATFPATYDLRDHGKLTAIRNQGGSGSCWAFAAYGSLESWLLPVETWDFSENNLKNRSGFDYDPNEGGNREMATAYLARWSGPVRESDDPYSDLSVSSPPGLPVRKHVQNVLWLPDRTSPTDNDALKDAVMTHGAVDVTMLWSPAAYQPSTHAYYCATDGANHGVCIVGWDDNYPVASFNAPGPTGPGAWLVRNSWGTWWGDSGYFWVSYYDASFGRGATIVTAESTTNYASVYQYDPLGFVGRVSWGDPSIWYANVFTTASTDTIAAAGLYALAPGTAYEIRVYLDPTSGPIRSSGYASTTSGTMATMGFHTVPLSTAVTVPAGHRFSVVVHASTTGVSSYAPLEYPYAGYSSGATAETGQSYASNDGTSWGDVATWQAGANVCLKAYTAGIDTTPPTTQAVVDPAPNAAGWNHTNPTVALYASDNPGGSGVASVTYRLDGGQTTTVSATTASVPVSGEGTHTLEFYATDLAANAETARTLTVRIDATPPTSTGTATTTTATLSAVDATSGVAGIQYKLDGAGWTAYTAPIPLSRAPHTLLFCATDNAGNQEAQQTLTTPDNRLATRVYAPAVAAGAGQSVTLNAWLLKSDKTGYIAGRTLHVSVAGTEVGTGTSDSCGRVQVSYTLPQGATGSIPFTVAFTNAGDPDYLPSSAVSSITVTQTSPSRVYLTNTTGAAGERIRLQAWLLKSDASAYIAGRTLTFAVGSATVGSGTTDASGRAIVYWTIPSGLSSPQSITVTFAGDATYGASGGTASLTISGKIPTRVYVPAQSGTAGANVTLNAWLLKADNTAYVAGKTLHFLVDSVEVGTGVTDAYGRARLVYALPAGWAGSSHSLTVSFTDTADAVYTTSSGASTLSVQ